MKNFKERFTDGYAIGVIIGIITAGPVATFLFMWAMSEPIR